MGKKIQAVKGMNDLLPIAQKNFALNTSVWQAFENLIQQWTRRFGYSQIRTPIVEQTGLFVRSIGEETDVVGKEMYTFRDSNDELSLSLRPEGTASCLRAVVEHDLTYNAPQKLWYMGPMFRRERPQKGRYRQFHQVGIEALGFSGADIDAEIIMMCADLWHQLGIAEYLTLEINSLGNRQERAEYRAALVEYLMKFKDKLDEDSCRRLIHNPLRILDSKNPDLQGIIQDAPRLVDYLGEQSSQHYQTVKDFLTGLGINFVENPRLVRGLDYYNQTVFEWTTDKLGSQATVCGGGRYDGLMEELGGRATASIGFALGVERLLLLVQEFGKLKVDDNPDIYIMQYGEGTLLPALKIAKLLRKNNFYVAQYSGTQKLDKQMKRADASGARFAVIIGDNELLENKVTLKDLRGTYGQVCVAEIELVNTLKEWNE